MSSTEVDLRDRALGILAVDLLQHRIGKVHRTQLPSPTNTEPPDVVGVIEALIPGLQEAKVAAIHLDGGRHIRTEQNPVLISQEKFSG